MSKYDALHSFLTTMGASEIVVTFEQLDEIAALPRSAHLDRQWWANDERVGNAKPQTKAWLSAGYQAYPDMCQKVVSFRRIHRD